MTSPIIAMLFVLNAVLLTTPISCSKVTEQEYNVSEIDKTEPYRGKTTLYPDLVDKPFSFNMVPDSVTARTLCEVYFSRYFGASVANLKPYRVVYTKKLTWVVTCLDQSNSEILPYEIELDQFSGKVLRIEQGGFI
jgi:hypothetical protein